MRIRRQHQKIRNRRTGRSRARRRVTASGAKTQSAKALAVAAALAGGTSAYADVIRFDNHGEFEWRPPQCDGHLWLDVTKPAVEQSGQQGPTSFSQWYYYGVCNDPEKAGNYMYAGTSGRYSALWVQADGYGGTLDGLAGGTLIGPDSAWGDRSTFSMYKSNCCYENDWGPLGTVAYAGIQFRLNNQVHYGWIKARMTDPRAAQLEALAWGYEDQPNTPVEAGAGGAECTGREKLRAKCKGGGNEFAINASMKKGTPGTQVTFRLDDDPNTDRVGVVNNRGKTKTKFQDVSEGAHTVAVVECEVQKGTECRP